MSEVPLGWALTALESVVTFSIGGLWGSDSGSAAPETSTVAVMRGADYRNWATARASCAAIRSVPTKAAETRRLEAGDLVVEVSGGGPTQPVGRVVVIDEAALKSTDLPLILSNFCRRVVLSRDINPWFVYYQLLLKYLSGDTARFQTATTNIRNLNFTKYLAETALAVAPAAEQERIVAVIEEQFSRLDVAETALSRARHRFERLRLAILRTAVHNLAWPKKRLAEIVTTSSGGTPSRRRPEYFGGTIPWVKSGELRDGRVSACEETITELGLKNSSAKVFERGTLLIALYGATVGKLGILDIDAATNQAVCAIMPHDPEMVPYLWFVLRSKRPELIAAGQGGAQPNISQTILNRLTVPVPPLDEQLAIAAQIERTLSNVDALSRAVDVALDHSRALRRAILERAFAGKLVPQNPTDEPVSALLDRVCSERALRGEQTAGSAQRKSAKRAA